MAACNGWPLIGRLTCPPDARAGVRVIDYSPTFGFVKRESSGIHHTAIYVTVVTYAAKSDAGRLCIRMALSHGDFINYTALGVC